MPFGLRMPRIFYPHNSQTKSFTKFVIILGIDPGTASTGYGIVEKIKNGFKCLGCGVIHTEAGRPAAERLQRLNNELNKIIKIYRPQVMSVENVYFFRNLKTVMPVSQAKGVILLTAAKKNLIIKEFTPLQVKLAVTGNGWAEKEKVQEKIKKILKLKEAPKSDDAADALAIALTYVMKKEAA